MGPIQRAVLLCRESSRGRGTNITTAALSRNIYVELQQEMGAVECDGLSIEGVHKRGFMLDAETFVYITGTADAGATQ